MRALQAEFRSDRLSLVPAALMIAALVLAAAVLTGPAQAQTEPQTESAAPAAVAVPRAVLERYVGDYALNGTVATVSITGDGRLTFALGGQPAGPPLRAVSTNEFIVDDEAGARLIFEGEGPRTPRLRSQYMGSEMVGTRFADGAPRPALDAGTRKAAVSALAAGLRQRYIYPEVGESTAARIEAALAAGDYDRLSDPGAFAARLGADLGAAAHDHHMRVISTFGAPPAGPPPGMPAAGIVRADRLAGGVGYIELTGFGPLPVFKEPIDRAMTALAGSTALIIDTRHNGGGDPAAVSYLTSFLVPPGQPALLNEMVRRVPGTTDFERQPITSTPTPVSFAGVPVYVLTSARTFSGGEGFAYEVQAMGLGKVIGEVTGGGANPAGPVELGEGLVAMIPFARAENPVTKTNWEGRGVQPDVAVPAADGLRTALEKLGQEPVAEIAAASREQVFGP